MPNHPTRSYAPLHGRMLPSIMVLLVAVLCSTMLIACGDPAPAACELDDSEPCAGHCFQIRGTRVEAGRTCIQKEAHMGCKERGGVSSPAQTCVVRVHDGSVFSSGNDHGFESDPDTGWRFCTDEERATVEVALQTWPPCE